MVQVRLANLADVGAIVDVLREAFEVRRNDFTPGAFAAVRPSAPEVIQRLSEGPIWVAVLDGKIFGTASVISEPAGLYIRSMAVSPKAQGRGVGHQLMQSIEDYAFEQDFERMFLYTTFFSHDAIHLYEKHGFSQSRETSAEEWFGVPGLEMDKKLGRN